MVIQKLRKTSGHKTHKQLEQWRPEDGNDITATSARGQVKLDLVSDIVSRGVVAGSPSYLIQGSRTV